MLDNFNQYFFLSFMACMTAYCIWPLFSQLKFEDTRKSLFLSWGKVKIVLEIKIKKICTPYDSINLLIVSLPLPSSPPVHLI